MLESIVVFATFGLGWLAGGLLATLVARLVSHRLGDGREDARTAAPYFGFVVAGMGALLGAFIGFGYAVPGTLAWQVTTSGAIPVLVDVPPFSAEIAWHMIRNGIAGGIAGSVAVLLIAGAVLGLSYLIDLIPTGSPCPTCKRSFE